MRNLLRYATPICLKYLEEKICVGMSSFQVMTLHKWLECLAGERNYLIDLRFFSFSTNQLSEFLFKENCPLLNFNSTLHILWKLAVFFCKLANRNILASYQLQCRRYRNDSGATIFRSDARGDFKILNFKNATKMSSYA